MDESALCRAPSKLLLTPKDQERIPASGGVRRIQFPDGCACCGEPELNVDGVGASAGRDAFVAEVPLCERCERHKRAQPSPKPYVVAGALLGLAFPIPLAWLHGSSHWWQNVVIRDHVALGVALAWASVLLAPRSRVRTLLSVAFVPLALGTLSMMRMQSYAPLGGALVAGLGAGWAFYVARAWGFASHTTRAVPVRAHFEGRDLALLCANRTTLEGVQEVYGGSVVSSFEQRFPEVGRGERARVGVAAGLVGSLALVAAGFTFPEGDRVRFEQTASLEECKEFLADFPNSPLAGEVQFRYKLARARAYIADGEAPQAFSILLEGALLDEDLVAFLPDFSNSRVALRQAYRTNPHFAKQVAERLSGSFAHPDAMPLLLDALAFVPLESLSGMLTGDTVQNLLDDPARAQSLAQRLSLLPPPSLRTLFAAAPSLSAHPALIESLRGELLQAEHLPQALALVALIPELPTPELGAYLLDLAVSPDALEALGSSFPSVREVAVERASRWRAAAEVPEDGSWSLSERGVVILQNDCRFPLAFHLEGSRGRWLCVEGGTKRICVLPLGDYRIRYQTLSSDRLGEEEFTLVESIMLFRVYKQSEHNPNDFPDWFR